MCLKRDTKYSSSNESIGELNEEINLEWPFEQVTDARHIVACSICFYPITYEEHINDKIKSENDETFALVIPITKLFSGISAFRENFLEQWKTQIYCSNCGMLLSFLSPEINNTTENNFEKVMEYVNYGPQIVILSSYLIFQDSYNGIYTRFIQTNP